MASAHTLEELEKAAQENRLEDLIIPTDAFLTKYPPLIVKESAVRKLVFGNYLTKEEFEEETVFPARKEAPFCVSLEEGTESEKPRFRIYDAAGNFYAVYYYDAKTAQYKCDKMFIEEPNNTCN